MKIGIMSDTHGSATAFQKIIGGIFSDADLIIHCGDICYHGVRNPLPSGYDTYALAQLINETSIPLVICKGNCDSEVDQLVIDLPIESPYLILQLGKLRIVVHHGHLFSDQEMVTLTARWGIGLCISGHTHIPRLERKGNTIFLNPGSPSLPKGKNIPTVGIIEIPEKQEKASISLWDLEQGAILDMPSSMVIDKERK